MLEVEIGDSGFQGFTLTNVSDMTSNQGSTVEELDCLIRNLHRKYSLTVERGCFKDRLLIYVDDLALIPELFGYQITNGIFDKIVQCGNIEFRSWKEFTRKDPIPVMKDWGNRFKEAKFPYITPSHYMRKRLKKVAKGKASSVFPSDIKQLGIIESAVHGGVLYNRPEEGIINNLLGFDICSAYIHSLVFKKHASSEMQQTVPGRWKDYLKSLDKGSIGLYRITYNSIFSSIRCFKDMQEKNLETGEHTVDIALSNIDLNILIETTYPGISSITCMMLYTFELDYLPVEFRKFCAEEFFKNQTLPK